MPPLVPYAPADETSPLSPYLKDLVQKLYEAAEGFRAHPAVESSGKAQVAAYEAINDLVRTSAHDTREFVATLLQVSRGAGARAGVRVPGERELTMTCREGLPPTSLCDTHMVPWAQRMTADGCS